MNSYPYCGLLLLYLVGGIPIPLKNMKVSWDYYFQYMEKKVPNNQPAIDCGRLNLMCYLKKTLNIIKPLSRIIITI